MNLITFYTLYRCNIYSLSTYYRCKLFYKKESEFKEKGVGTLHLKLVSEGKLQLLVRADTNLGKTRSWSNKHKILFFKWSTRATWLKRFPHIIYKIDKNGPSTFLFSMKPELIDNAHIFCSSFS